MLIDSAESNTGRIQTEMYSPAIGVFNSSNVIFNINNSLTHLLSNKHALFKW